MNALGAETYGVVLAKGQADACIKNGLNVKHMIQRILLQKLLEGLMPSLPWAVLNIYVQLRV